MAKLVVIKEPEGDRTPYLRGILTQSLVNGGLSFDDAYEIAQTLKSELKEASEITSSDLKERVGGLLKEKFGAALSLPAKKTAPPAPNIIVRTPGRASPFSVGILSHSLIACAIPEKVARKGAHRVFATLRTGGYTEIDHKTLRRLTHRCLREHCSTEAADRYLSWRKFERSGRPLIILIGGATGTGKSTVTSEVAYRTGIARLQSTDMMREIIRAYLTHQAVPTLGYSSFEAWRGIHAPPEGMEGNGETALITGFLAQFTTIKPAMEKAVARAVTEGEDMIIEGVHILPMHMDLQDAGEKAILVPVMLATLKKKLLGEQLKRRCKENTERKSSRYSERLDDIWELQSYLLSEADRYGVPIIANRNVYATVFEVLDLVGNEIEQAFPARKLDVEKDL
ncbi:MAG: zeta toxin family protein [Pseudomonadota bacterium]|nr:zeta toxin family protein [Pseudomonadota bacterium]